MAKEYEYIDAVKLAKRINDQILSLPDYYYATIRAVRREWTKELKNVDPKDVVELGLQLTSYSQYEQWHIAYELIHFHPAALQSLRAKTLEALGDGLWDWKIVDVFGTYLTGPSWLAGQISDKDIHKWARSEDQWWRRTALVSTIPLNTKSWGGSGDVPRTLEVCRLLVKDHEDTIVKALSWALRQASQYDVQTIKDFMKEYDDVLAARIKREVRNKLKTGVKNPKKN